VHPLKKRYHGRHGHERDGTELDNHGITEPERSVNSRSLRRRREAAPTVDATLKT